MANSIAVAVVAILAVASHVSAQWWGMTGQSAGAGVGTRANPILGAWGGRQTMQDNNRYLTCSAMNSDGDSLKVTFSLEANNPWGGGFGRQWGGSSSLRVAAVLSTGQTSSLQGQFELVVTTGSRSEEMCLSSALGTILDERNWWSMSRRPSGIVGQPIVISAGHVATINEEVTRLQFQQLNGRGLAVCPSNQISGNTCNDMIPLCCRLGLDSQPATTPFAAPGQISGMQFGMQQGPTGGLNGGFNLGMGAGQGFATMGAGTNQGLAIGAGVNQGMSMGNGMNQGLAMGAGDNQGMSMGNGMNQGLAMGAGVNQGMSMGNGMNQGQGLPSMGAGSSQGLPMRGGVNQGQGQGFANMGAGINQGMRPGGPQNVQPGMNGGMGAGALPLNNGF